MRIDVARDGACANDISLRAALSTDGRWVTFSSRAANLVADDDNATYDIFLRDRAAETTNRVSLNNEGAQGNGPSSLPVSSGDATIVAFVSEASNLVADDANRAADVFVRDVVRRTTVRVSRGVAGEPNGPSSAPSISADGRWIAFHSAASNLVAAADRNDALDVFLFDRTTGETVRVSETSGAPGNGDSRDPVVSSDGALVAFASSAGNLVSGDANGVSDVFVWTRATRRIERISVGAAGAEANGRSGGPALGANGKVIAFESEATNLVAGDANKVADVFVRDRASGETTRVSVPFGGGEADRASLGAAISSDGRFVAFVSDATNLVPDDKNTFRDIFLRDRALGRTTRVNLAIDGASSSNGPATGATISANGMAVAFESGASNLVERAECRSTNIYVRDRVTGEAKCSKR